MHGNCSVFARKPTRGEARRLRQVARSTNRNLRDRALCVLLSAQGQGVPEIAVRLARGRLYVVRWIRRFNAHGFEGLETRPRPGRPRKFTEALIQRIKALATSNPRDLGLHFTSWSLPKFQRYLIRRRVVAHISWDSIRRLLRQAGLSWREAQQWMVSDDPQFGPKKNGSTGSSGRRRTRAS